MNSEITRCEELSEKDGRRQPFLLIDVEEADQWMTFSFSYRLRIENGPPYKNISGTVEHLGGTSSFVVEDADWDDYVIKAEAESINAITAYLRERFPQEKIKGVIRGTFASLYHSPREYVI